MSSIRKVLRVFLASPGDLQDEREAVHDAVVEINDLWADMWGYQIELMGWEDTVPGYGRPQEIINQEVDRCDLFIGMIWKRWGTPPDRDGRFTSGFHEEFERSMARREQSESPEISLFFKQISNELMTDPGEDLKRVLKFREKIIAEKKILYQEFSTQQDLERLGRKCITAYVNRVRATDESSEPNEARVKRAESESEKTGGERGSPESSPLSAEGFAFLESFVDKIGQEEAMEVVSASDVARFRLLANSISQPGNEDMDLGAHDINILFSARAEGAKLGRGETYCLTRLGFQHLSNENVPLWGWYSDLADSAFELTLLSSCAGANDDVKVGAMRVLGLLGRDISKEDEGLTPEWVLNGWFSEDSSARVRSAALDYLARKGAAEDFSVARKEYGRNDHGTSRKALECMLGILHRTDHGNSAQQLVLESQFESLDADTLQAVLDGFENLETATLRLGLEHRNAQIRLKTLRVLLRRGSLNHEMAERLSKDSDASIRHEAVTALEKLGRSFTEEEVKKVLVRPGKQSSSGLLGSRLSDSDWKGKELFERYRLESLMKRPESELIRKVEGGFMYDDAAYFARAEKYFAKHAEELRRDIDDAFNAYYKERIRRTKATFGGLSADLVGSHNDLNDFHRKRLTRQGLDILCRAGNREDLQRVRGNLQSGYAGTSKADVEYLGKHGGWEDISLIANADIPNFGGNLLEQESHEDFRNQVAKIVIGLRV